MIQLTSRNTYIIPTGFGWLFALVVISLASGAINYQLNPAFFMVFLLVTCSFIGMLQTHRNLKGLSFRCLPIEDVQQGQPVKVTLFIQSAHLARYSLRFSLQKQFLGKVDIIPVEGSQITLGLLSAKRGYFKLPRIRVSSEFPLSLFRVWSNLSFEKYYYVYPEPQSPGFWPEALQAQNTEPDNMNALGDDELYEVKSVTNQWVQPGRMAWKISARGQGWYVKSLRSPAGEQWVFRIEDLPTHEVEESLKQLSYWLLSAESLGHAYALDLKGQQTPMSKGKSHLQHCLRQLAVFIT